MRIRASHLIYFSPAGTTAKVVRAIGGGLRTPVVEHDFTRLSRPSEFPFFQKDELALFGLPVYMGRVPIAAVPRLRAMRADGTPCVIVAVYGNRAFDDFLVEMEDIVRELGFIPVAAAAFIGEHAITRALATGRPHAGDLEAARLFGEQVMDKMARAEAAPALAPGSIPGRRPYETYSAGRIKRDDREKIANGPTVDETCTGCRLCADACPIGNINPDNLREINPYDCLRCHACVRACPAGAIRFRKPGFLRHIADLERNFSTPDKEVLLVL